MFPKTILAIYDESKLKQLIKTVFYGYVEYIRGGQGLQDPPTWIFLVCFFKLLKHTPQGALSKLTEHTQWPDASQVSL